MICLQPVSQSSSEVRSLFSNYYNRNSRMNKSKPSITAQWFIQTSGCSSLANLSVPFLSLQNSWIFSNQEGNSLLILKRGNFLLVAKIKVSTPQVNTITQKHLSSLLTLETVVRIKFSFKFHTQQLFLPLLVYFLCLLNNVVQELQPNGSFQRKTQMRPTSASSTRTKK